MSNYSDLGRSTARSQPLTTMRAQVERMDDTKKASRKAKILIAFGLILPIVAGVIGVVAWAVNAGTVLGTNKINMPFKSTQVNNKLVGIGQRPFLENRMDSRFGPNPTLIKRPDKLTSLDLESDRVKTAINDFSNSIPEQEAFSSSIGQSKGKKDDVFFVQHMNNGKRKMTQLQNRLL
ncbi:uncharacterized protein LOC143225891 isoform X2 [Tachypleus tridentatus]|uniref:uncharacterized protein LOC143225891 isoform X2 n=1 Tax=Tachypleus tridentatus TaxID=6853 RepID=UPI003FD6BFF9